MSERKEILLTGAAGRVGALLRPLLLQRFRVRLCDIVPVEAESPNESVLTGDLSESEFALEAVNGTHGVVHFAGLVAPGVSFEQTLNPNYRAVLALLEACRRSGTKRFVFASSHHAVGLHPSDRQYDENAAAAPDGFYGLSKIFGEAACALYSQRFGIKSLLIRIGNADPKVVDGRRERMWTSARDLFQLIEVGLDNEKVGCDVVYGVSQCPDELFPNAAAKRLGYVPQDFSASNHATSFRPLPEIDPAERARVGGFFAVKELPNPFEVQS